MTTGDPIRLRRSSQAWSAVAPAPGTTLRRRDAVLILGPPGAGKSTIAASLARRINYFPFLTGQVLRGILTRGNVDPALALVVAQRMARNLPMPVDTFCAIADATIGGAPWPGIVFDGFPRSVEQSMEARTVLGRLGVSTASVFVLDIPDELLFDRVSARLVCASCGALIDRSVACCATPEPTKRRDDTVEALRDRLHDYNKSAPEIEATLRQWWPVHHLPATASVTDCVAAMVSSIRPGVSSEV